MEIAHAARIEPAAEFGPTVAATSWRAAGFSSSPSNRWPSQSGTAVPVIPLIRWIAAKFDTGMIPGTISASIPAARQASWKRKKVSGSKKNWVIARVAPASSLRLRLSRSAAGLAASGCVSG